MYNKYYIGKVCSGQRGTAFELATTMVQLLIEGGFICLAGRAEITASQRTMSGQDDHFLLDKLSVSWSF